MVLLGGIGEAALAVIGGVGTIIGAMNPFDWLLIIMILLSASAQTVVGIQESGLSVDSLMMMGAQHLAALVMVAMLKIGLPDAANLFFFVVFWTLTAPNILNAANMLGIAQYFTFWGIPLLTVGFFIPYLIMLVFFFPMIMSWYNAFGVS